MRSSTRTLRARRISEFSLPCESVFKERTSISKPTNLDLMLPDIWVERVAVELLVQDEAVPVPWDSTIHDA